MKRPQIIAEVIEAGPCRYFQEGQDACQLQACRGLQGACPFALVRDSSFARQVGLAVRGSMWWQRFGQGNGKALPHHLHLRVALAACPNACTMPQIRDIGLIVTTTPQAIRSECDGCGCCERACREKAITIHEGRADFHKDRCLGCGQCVDKCPNGAIESGSARVRVLVGGRMGRHPRWALDLCEVDLTSAGEVVRAFLDRIAREMPSPVHVADAVEKVGIGRLRQEMSSAARAPECMMSQERSGPACASGEASPGINRDRE
jgi:dissimilatory sulfite reductase (desulfoviridin) alpha/beta subunit